MTLSTLHMNQSPTYTPNSFSWKQKSFSYLRVTGYQGPKCPVTQDACFHDLHKILNIFLLL